MDPWNTRGVPKKKKSPRRPSPPAQNQSPLRVGGRALGELQVPFRTFLEREASEDDPLSPADTEARLMESLGWLLIAEGQKPTASSATYFQASELHDLFTEVVPVVAGDNELWADELLDETRFAWLQFLSFLDGADHWDGSLGEVLDCLHVADGGSPPDETMLRMYEAAAAVGPERQGADQGAVPAVGAAAAALRAFDDGLRVDSDEEPGEVVLGALAGVAEWLPATVLWEDLVSSGLLVVRGGVARPAGDRGDELFLGSVVVTSVLAEVVDELPDAAAAVVAVLRAGTLGEEVPDVDDLTETLVRVGVLTDDSPRRVPEGLLPAVVAFTRDLERLEEERRLDLRDEALQKAQDVVRESALGVS